MNSSLVKAVEDLNQAQAECENDNNFLKAIIHYNSALAHFATAAVNDEITNLSLKDEVKRIIEFCVSRTKKLIVLQNEQDTMSNTGNPSLENEATKSTLLLNKPNLKFKDVCGMETIKRDLKLAIILPIKHPELFIHGREPYKAFLFFGPPGTGKSFLARAIAGHSDSNFFSVKASDVLSKYIGESETFIKNLFEAARKARPSIIFIDEIDYLASKRTGHDTGTTRGMKTELFVQMEGLLDNNDGIFVLAATNTPYDLDDAILRRFDKLVYIPLPGQQQRFDMFKKMLIHTENMHFSDDDFNKLAVLTKGFSASDIHKVCRKANNLTIDRLLETTHYRVSDENDTGECIYTPCEEMEPGARNVDIMDIPSGCVSFTPITTIEDAVKCVRNAQPIVTSENVEKIEKFAKEKGALSNQQDPTVNDEPSFWDNVSNLCDGLCKII